MRQALCNLRIAITEHTNINNIQKNQLMSTSGEVFPFDICLWAGGFRGQPLARQAGLPVNERDQVLVDPYLRALAHPNIYALGDAAFPTHHTGAPIRMSLFAALATGAHAADNLVHRLKGKAERPLGFSTYGRRT